MNIRVGHVETTIYTVFNVIDEEGNTIEMQIFNGEEVPELKFKGALSETKFKKVLDALNRKKEELREKHQKVIEQVSIAKE